MRCFAQGLSKISIRSLRLSPSSTAAKFVRHKAPRDRVASLRRYCTIVGFHASLEPITCVSVRGRTGLALVYLRLLNRYVLQLTENRRSALPVNQVEHVGRNQQLPILVCIHCADWLWVSRYLRESFSTEIKVRVMDLS